MRVTGIFLMWFQPEFYRKSIYSLAPEQGDAQNNSGVPC